MNKWRLLNTGLRDGLYNMALDQALVNSVAEEMSPPVVRFFGWNPPAVSLGYNQKTDDLDIEACKRAGFDVVRRPTGGRAVLHKDEFTYSVIAPESDRLIGGTILETYQSIASGLLAGLKKLGVPAEMVKSSTPDAATKGSPLCFAAAGRYEISVSGKKLIGSAQRRINGVILQQGSLLLSCDQKEDIFKTPASQVQAGTLKEILGRQLDYHQVSAAMKDGFSESWKVAFEDSRVSQDEEMSVTKLMHEAKPV